MCAKFKNNKCITYATKKEKIYQKHIFFIKNNFQLIPDGFRSETRFSAVCIFIYKSFSSLVNVCWWQRSKIKKTFVAWQRDKAVTGAEDAIVISNDSDKLACKVRNEAASA